MKITGAQGLNTPPPAKRAEKRTGGDFKVDAARTAAGGASSAAPVGPIASIDALIAIQGEGGGANADARRQALLQGEGILNLLDGVRLGLLTGGVPQSKLKALAAAVEARRGDGFADPRLASVLDDIELRARVELAKHGA